MAGRRIHRPETKRRSGGAGCLTQFLVAAVCAVALGYFFGSYLFKQTTAVKPPSSPAQQGQPAPATPAKPTPPAMPPSTAGKVNLPELTIFQVQLGAFSQKANADRLVDAIKKQGWPAEEVTAGNLIQTRAGSFFGRQRAEALKDKCTADQLRPVVVTKVLPAKDLTYEAAEKEYSEFVQAAAGGLAEALLAAEEGQVSEAQTQLKAMITAAEKLPDSPGGAKGELVAFLQRLAGELGKAAQADGDVRQQAVSRTVAEFARWYAGLGGPSGA